MSLNRYVIRMAITTGLSATAIGLLTHNPNWLLNLPFGLFFGAMAGLVLWKPHNALHTWLDREDDR